MAANSPLRPNLPLVVCKLERKHRRRLDEQESSDSDNYGSDEDRPKKVPSAEYEEKSADSNQPP